MRDENGAEVGRTWSDLTAEVSRAIVTLGAGSEEERLEGKDWTAWSPASGVIIISIAVNE